MINHFLSHCFENAILVQIYLTLKECKLEIAINNEASLFYRFKFLLEYFYKIPESPDIVPTPLPFLLDDV